MGLAHVFLGNNLKPYILYMVCVLQVLVALFTTLEDHQILYYFIAVLSSVVAISMLEYEQDLRLV